MPSIDVFVTSILSNPQLRGRHERVRRALASARAPYAEHDVRPRLPTWLNPNVKLTISAYVGMNFGQVAGDEKAKSLWKRKNGGKNELPFILVDGEPVGNIEDMDEA